MLIVRLFTLVLLLSALACNSGTPANQAPPAAGTPTPAPAPAPAVAANSKARIAANPNPVPAGTGLGATTVTWDTGEKSWGQVYLAVEGQPEILFVEGPSGSKPAPWIGVGPVYEFRLYAGKDHQTLLASVRVTRAS